MGENVSHIEEALHNAKGLLRALTGADDDIANAAIAEINKAMSESLPALARQAEALQRENAELRKMLAGTADALTPFADAVFNDNGDMTITLDSQKPENFIRAYFAERRARTLLKEEANAE